MASKEYLEKLKDPRWQQKRLRIFERDGWACRNCGNKDDTLHVHHLYYLDVEPWEYQDFALHTMCAPCHENSHGDKRYAIESFIQSLARRGQNHNFLWALSVEFDFTTNENGYSPLSDEQMQQLRFEFRAALEKVSGMQSRLADG